MVYDEDVSVENTVSDEFSLPLIEDLIDKLKDAKVFRELDLTNGVFYFRIIEESVQKLKIFCHTSWTV